MIKLTYKETAKVLTLIQANLNELRNDNGINYPADLTGDAKKEYDQLKSIEEKLENM